ncbi:MAG: MFS transporter [Phycisphaerae bacterium]|jgi:2-oxoisovalerate dehydrogenase E1 component
MIRNRAEIVDENFRGFLEAWQAERDGAAATRPLDAPPQDADPAIGLTGRVLWELFESQVTCRLLDIVAREMRARDEGFYTIGSAGHEGNVVLGRLVRHTDPSLLHYRSGALMVERARQLPGQDPVRDIAHSLAASVEDPIAGGRHKVFGSVPLGVPPQTSTIASHLPKAVGMAIALGKMKRQRLPLRVPRDAIVLCSFGDASVNHAVAQTAFNSASWSAYQGVPVPILFVCEDNGLGISVHTPPGWVETRMRRQPGFQYFRADGLDLVNAYEVAAQAVAYCRTKRAPTFLHLTTIRMLGHAGSDVETEYHSIVEIEAVEACDPLLASARLLLDQGYVIASQIRELYDAIGKRVREAALAAAAAPKLSSAAEVVAPLAPYTPERVRAEAARSPDPAARAAAFGGDGALPETRGPRHMAVLINQGLHDTLVKYPEAAVFGEDVAQKGGVYHVTAGLWKTFGAARVFNTLLDETSILGMAIGAAQLGMLPIPEIQYLAYYHNAEDQLRGEACSLQYFSKAQFANPMVVRIAGMAYQKGFGGHFHNDNSVAALRDIPGLVVALPSRGDDAVKMFRTCLALAKVDGRVCAFIEPIALYMTKDLHDAGDRAWLFEYPPPGEFIPIGEGRVYHEDARDLTIVTYGNGVHLSLRAARTLEREHGVRARVLDLRWLNPLNVDFIREHAAATGQLLVVDECRRTGGMAEPILASIAEFNTLAAREAQPPREGGAASRAPIRSARVCAEDTYIPLGPAANHVLPQESGIVAAALALTADTGAARTAAHPSTRARAASRR